MDVLDLGCGDGTTASPGGDARRRTFSASTSPSNLVAAGNARAQQLGLANCRFQQGDATDLTRVEDDSFDLVLSMFGAMFAPQAVRGGEGSRPRDTAGRPDRDGQLDPQRPRPSSPRSCGISAAYSPPPPEGFVSPMTWGVEEHSRRSGSPAPASRPRTSRASGRSYSFELPENARPSISRTSGYYGPTMNAYAAAATDAARTSYMPSWRRSSTSTTPRKAAKGRASKLPTCV